MKVKAIVIGIMIIVLCVLSYIGMSIYSNKKQDLAFNTYIALINDKFFK